jgi:hypothetical protein
MRDDIKHSFFEMCGSIARTVRPGHAPQRYHGSSRIPEANTVYHFVKALEKRLPNSLAYLEFTFHDGFCDAVVVSESSLVLVEAKSTLLTGKATSMLARLEEQASAMQDASCSLRTYLGERLLEPLQGQEWGCRKIDELWGVVADTFEDRWKKEWLAFPHLGQRYPTLSRYEVVEQRNESYSGRGQDWWHLLGIADLV